MVLLSLLVSVATMSSYLSWYPGMSNLLVSEPCWKRKSFGLGHTLNTFQHVITKKSHNVLGKFTISCWSAFIAILGCMWPLGYGLDTPVTMVSFSFVNIFIILILKEFFFDKSNVSLFQAVSVAYFFPGVWTMLFCFFAWLVIYFVRHGCLRYYIVAHLVTGLPHPSPPGLFDWWLAGFF